MKIKSAEFESSAPDLRSCPKWPLPEFAFIGRSNVGKSSLINLLVERRDLAKVSDTPGKTKLINFFLINECWSLVDLPGYGYAAVGEQRRLEFNEAIADFLTERENLRRVFVLIDSRHSPQRIDLEFVRWLETCAKPYSLVFTKGDKQSTSQTGARVSEFQAAVGRWRSELPEIVRSSSKTRYGRKEILDRIEQDLTGINRSAQ
jgi:GTP-binding protein